MPSSKPGSSGIRKIHQLIENKGFESLIPCLRCSSLDKICVFSERSKHCSEYNCAKGTVRCEMLRETFTDAEWRRLLKSQSSLDAEEEALIKAQ
ncbi:uncharacterized protein N7483_001740 [Penicillium malachiteum]|uniref:uncharacterized protein n=1 Tax=Penicillium malachiteum TaxID=1324776 RepID=UPI0025494C92|nr:uncharacterized protein N7483_001740 [Penicillium malachiteum]KAJ5736615.1 hypothetical protein N7483_001740 [Penicillium malachiteum]